MPTYTYHCSACGTDFEQYQKFTENALETCPSCGGSVRRVIHASGVLFKGSGWYINDSRGSKSAAPADSSSEKPADKAAPVTEPAPAAAPAAASAPVPATPAAAE